MSLSSWIYAMFRRNQPPAVASKAIGAVLYTRKGCHLCDVARETLHRYGVDVLEVDIDQHPDWRSLYDCCIPVVWIQGRERFRGRVDERLLRRLLRGIKRS